jgi:predicted RNA-binding protein
MAVEVQSNIVEASNRKTINRSSCHSCEEVENHSLNLKALYDIDKIHRQERKEEHHNDIERFDQYLSNIIIDEAIEAMEVNIFDGKDRYGSAINHNILMEIDYLEMNRHLNEDLNALVIPTDYEVRHEKVFTNNVRERGNIRGRLS